MVTRGGCVQTRMLPFSLERQARTDWRAYLRRLKIDLSNIGVCSIKAGLDLVFLDAPSLPRFGDEISRVNSGAEISADIPNLEIDSDRGDFIAAVERTIQVVIGIHPQGEVVYVVQQDVVCIVDS
jgi:hypothetical protein